ncbi:MAG: UDP-2,4-diacetamido-2,4,6-trideoxy-beta-L-altropyranose hydrolase [Carboxydocellales bacterium]
MKLLEKQAKVLQKQVKLLRKQVPGFQVLIRADGGQGIGIGHVMRCMALASELAKFGARINFIGKLDLAVSQYIEEHGFETIVIPKEINLITDLEFLIREIAAHKTDCVITDCYDLSGEYLAAVRKQVKLVVSVDDLNPFPFPAHTVINGNCYALEMSYQSSTGDTVFLLGLPYLLLRNEFRDCPQHLIRQEVKNILVTVGGCDVLNLVPNILSSLATWGKKLEINLVIGPGFNNREQINQAAGELEGNVNFLEKVTNMSELMLNCDLAITAGGSTLYELAATGTPAIAILQADNQVRAAAAMAKLGVCVNMGLGTYLFKQDLIRNLQLMSDRRIRLKLSEAGKELVDGMGSVRCSNIIAARLVEYLNC